MVNAKTTLVTLYEADGAGEHCHMGAASRANQVMFDWLDEQVGTQA
ncbi:dipeptidyl aminopeptidase/acylaminoacyl peptidase [Mycolicibacterium conceptionense]|nr:dipeptidyl aminopeptidase/acylaminoacyl peptidase [Mycolicibacterium conceptionense]